MQPPAAPQRDLTFNSTMSGFYKLGLVPLVLEVALLALAFHANATLPVTGDPLLRYLSVGVPAFWAAVIPIALIIAFAMFNGQHITVTPKAFAYRRGRFSIVVPWQDMTLKPSQERRFDKQFVVTSKTSQIVVRSLFFPGFDEMERAIEARLKLRDSADIRL